MKQHFHAFAPAVSGLLALVLLWSSFNALVLIGADSLDFVSSMPVSSHLWQIVEGEGEVTDGAVRLTAPGRRAWASAAAKLPVPQPIDRFAGLSLRVAEAGGAVEFEVGLAAPNSLAAFASAPVPLSRDGKVELNFNDLFFAGKEIGYVVVRARGGLDPPAEFQSIELLPAKPGWPELQGMLLKTLVNLELWNQRSINNQVPHFAALSISPVVAVVIWLTLSVSIHWLLFLKALAVKQLLLPASLLFLCGWLVLDTFWQLRLWVNHGHAIEMYWGKSMDQKRMAEADSDVFEFIQNLKSLVDDQERRFLIFAADGYSSGRARYFAVPQFVWSRVGLSPRWMRRARPGDVVALIYLRNELDVFVLDKDGLEPSPRETLSWVLGDAAGRDGEVVQLGDSQILRIREGAYPWLMQTPWAELSSGVWSLKIESRVKKKSGRVLVEVLARPANGGDAFLISSREIHFELSGWRSVQLPFGLHIPMEVHVRMREYDAQGLQASGIRIVPFDHSEDALLLSPEGEESHWIGRKLLETEVGVAYEIF